MANRVARLSTTLKKSPKPPKAIAETTAGAIMVMFITSISLLSLYKLWSLTSSIPLSDAFDSNTWRLLRFGLIQALLSTIISLTLGVMLGRAYVRRKHIRSVRWLSQIFNAAFLMPTIVTVFALIAVHGSNGWLSQIANSQGQRYIYGLSGIIIAHTFFNAPLAAQFCASALQTIPQQQWQIAQQLGLTQRNPWQRFYIIEWGVLKPTLYNAAAVIFLLCFTSFAIVLILGGGLWAGNLEVAIYQALRLQFEPSKAALLALVQITIGASIATLLLTLGKNKTSQHLNITAMTSSPITAPIRADSTLLSTRITDCIAIMLACGLILPVIAALSSAIIPEQARSILFSKAFVDALITSLIIAPASSIVAISMAIPLALASRSVKLNSRYKKFSALFEIPSFIILLTPPLTLSAGLFLWLNTLSHYSYLTWGLVILINAMLALPFASYFINAQLYRIAVDNNALALSVGLYGWRRFYWIEFPLMRSTIGLSFGLSSALSVGDVSVIALFGSQDFSTLPLLLYRLLGSYRIVEAGGVGWALSLLVLLLFFVGRYVIGGGIGGRFRNYA